MRSKNLQALLDPVRLAVLEHLRRSPASPSELCETIEGGSRPTTYRAIRQLEAMGLIRVAKRRAVRGVEERTWELAVDAEELAGGVPEPEHLLRAMTAVYAAFVAAPTRAFAADPSTDSEGIARWVRAKSVELHLGPDELVSLGRSLAELFQPYLEPREGAMPVRTTIFAVPTEEGRS